MKRTRDIRNKLKRQIEIVGLSLSPEVQLKPIDLAVIFDCEELTIKRDLNELRSYGIDIHSVPGRGVCLTGSVEPAMMVEMITQYLALANPVNLSDKATATLVRKQKSKALQRIILFQRSIESREIVLVDYEKTAGNIEKGKELCPARLFQADGQWRLIAKNDGILKQFLLAKITSAKRTERKFKRIPPEEVDALFSHSFRSFLGTERFLVRMHLSGKWAGLVKPRQLLEGSILRENQDGSLELEMMVNSLEEIAGWIVSRGEGIVVLEPEMLREMVLKLARGVLENYDSLDK